jgi:hypothetical protein
MSVSMWLLGICIFTHIIIGHTPSQKHQDDLDGSSRFRSTHRLSREEIEMVINYEVSECVCVCVCVCVCHRDLL